MKHQNTVKTLTKAGFLISKNQNNENNFCADNHTNGRAVSWIKKGDSALEFSKHVSNDIDGFIAHDSRLKSLIKFLKGE